ncbi:hypothetical protein F5884DRAFT_243856 [Xylogone sp. PMI_703]|nr:hypothetical protein F5884DRAFT_243856 [Xylogone sp. PMI_703]
MDLVRDILPYLLSSPIAISAGLIGIFGLLNLKSLPFVWHFRVFSAFFQQSNTSFGNNAYDILDSPLNFNTPRVFRPIVTSTRCSILEIDYMLHKSNSTYFSDLDINRVHLLLALFKNGVEKIQKQESSPKIGGKKKAVMPILGGTSASFRRAIPPFGKYDVVTRVLCWDEKWIYIVSWFVKAGSMSKSKKGSSGSDPAVNGSAKHESSAPPPIPKNVFATTISKYVIKAGSETVSPGRLMEASGLVPVGESEESRKVRGVIEKERQRALRYAKAFGELDGLHGEFDEGRDKIGFFKDL